MQIIEKIIQQNDKPRAEIVFDIEILEVDREAGQAVRIESDRIAAIGGIFSPVVFPAGSDHDTRTENLGGDGVHDDRGFDPARLRANRRRRSTSTQSRKASRRDFSLAVPAASSGSSNPTRVPRLVAKPQVRGADGSKEVPVSLGQEVPNHVDPDELHAHRHWWRRRQPAQFVPPQGPVGIIIKLTPASLRRGRRDGRTDRSRAARRGRRTRTVADETIPHSPRERSPRAFGCATANRTCWQGCCVKTRLTGSAASPARSMCRSSGSCFRQYAGAFPQTDLVMLLTPTSSGRARSRRRIFSPSSSDRSRISDWGDRRHSSVRRSHGRAAAYAGSNARLHATEHGSRWRHRRSAAGQHAGSGHGCRPPESGSRSGARCAAARAHRSANATRNAAPTAAAGAGPRRQPDNHEPTVGSAQVIVTPPGTTFRIGGGPYTVPISVVNASRLTAISLTLVFDPALLRVRSVQEGSFMRSGGAGATFTSEIGKPDEWTSRLCGRPMRRALRERDSSAWSSSTPSGRAMRR